MDNLQNSLRFQSDRRQIGAMLMLFGLCAVIQPLSLISAYIGPDGTEFKKEGDEPEIWLLIGYFCFFINGVFAVVIGYVATVHDWSHKILTMCLLVTIQTSFIPYVTLMTIIGQEAKKSPEESALTYMRYLPGQGQNAISSNYYYDFSEVDVRFLGAMGIITVFTYIFAYVGAIVFMTFALHAYNNERPESQNCTFYKVPLFCFSGFLALAGLIDLMTGSYVIKNFDNVVKGYGAVPDGGTNLSVNPYPGINVAIGLVQLLNGLWGMARVFDLHMGPHDVSFPISIFCQWVLVLALQDITQISYPSGSIGVALAPTFAAVSLGINIMPAFLDQKMRTQPDVFPEDYFLSTTTVVHKSHEGVGGPEASATYTKEEHMVVTDPSDQGEVDRNKVTTETMNVQV